MPDPTHAEQDGATLDETMVRKLSALRSSGPVESTPAEQERATRPIGWWFPNAAVGFVTNEQVAKECMGYADNYPEPFKCIPLYDAIALAKERDRYYEAWQHAEAATDAYATRNQKLREELARFRQRERRLQAAREAQREEDARIIESLQLDPVSLRDAAAAIRRGDGG